MKFFLFDNSNNSVVINEPEVLLVKEFADLWSNDRNKTAKDKTGSKKTRAYKELTYIWLMCDWSSPYSDYTEQERHKEALRDAGLTEEEWNNPEFRAACRKYRELQESSRSLKLIKSAQSVVDKITDYFTLLDLHERDEVSGKPIFKTKDIMAELSNVAGVVEQLKTLEILYKKEQEATSGLMGDVEIGFAD